VWKHRQLGLGARDKPHNGLDDGGGESSQATNIAQSLRSLPPSAVRPTPAPPAFSVVDSPIGWENPRYMAGCVVQNLQKSAGISLPLVTVV
jgi:hypothetical protein